MDTLGTRMKNYEGNYNYSFDNLYKDPFIIRLDGRAFHTWVKKMKFERPLDIKMIEMMQHTLKFMCENVQGCTLGYCQSDEISLLVKTDQTETTDTWFDGRIQKISSIAASMCTYAFNKFIIDKYDCQIPAFFDARCFVIPKNEIKNYFLWRQNDCIKNSIAACCQANFSQKQLLNKHQDDQLELLKTINFDWDALEPSKKYGTLCYKVEVPILNILTNEYVTRKKFRLDYDTKRFNENLDIFNNVC